MKDDGKTTVERFSELMTEEVLTARKERDDALAEVERLRKELDELRANPIVLRPFPRSEWEDM